MVNLDEGSLTVSCERSALDDAVIGFTEVLETGTVKHVVFRGCVVIVTGMSRAIEDAP